MDIHNWFIGIHNWIMDIHKSIMDITVTDDRYPGHVLKMAAREHMLGLAPVGEVMDTVAARHGDDDEL